MRRSGHLSRALAIIILIAPASVGGVTVDSGPYHLTGRVTTQSGQPLGGCLIEASYAGVPSDAAATTTDADGRYALALAAGTYDVRVTPPAGSGFGLAMALGRVVAAESVLDFVLVPASATSVELSGRVLDGLGEPLPGQTLIVERVGGWALPPVTTDGNGVFALMVDPGDYSLQLWGRPDDSAAAPDYYILGSVGVSVETSTTLDLRLPAQKVIVRVEDQAGQPVPGVALTTGEVYNPSLSLGPVAGVGYSKYLDAVMTDTEGNATLWLFPTQQPPRWGRYTITAHPPAGSRLATTNLQGVEVLAESSLTIVMTEPATLAGRLLDARGLPLAGQTVELYVVGGSGLSAATTGAEGEFAFSVTAGDYDLLVWGRPPDDAAAPDYFIIGSVRVRVDASTTLDLTLPARRVDVHVQDSSGQPVEGATVTVGDVYNPSLSLGPVSGVGYSRYMDGVATDANGDAVLWLFPTHEPPRFGLYTITAHPPAGSSLTTTGLENVAVVTDTAVTVVMAAPAALRGRLLDGLGRPLPGQELALWRVGAGQLPPVITDTEGRFSFGISPGIYDLSISGRMAPFAAAPPSYEIGSARITVSGDTDLELRLPARRVGLRVQDSGGAPVAGVGLTTRDVFNPSLSLGPTAGVGYSQYREAVVTDGDGTAVMWLFPTPTVWPGRYDIVATPPAGAPFAPFIVQGVAVDGDKDIVVVLQFVHDPPVTELLASPDPMASGAYPGPVTISFVATAAPGHSVSATHYSLDGGAAQPFAEPFTVNSPGSHVLRYWSVDSSTVYEIAKTWHFDIASDTVPPATTASTLPETNPGGWANGDTRVVLSATDNLGGTGVREIVYTMEGAQNAGPAISLEPAVAFDVTAEGTTIVTYYARDRAGNEERPRTLTIQLDRTPPVIGLATANPQELWPPNHKFVPVSVSLAASDHLSGLASCRVTSVSSNEPTTGPGDLTAPDWLLQEGLTVHLRAERTGAGAGRVYTAAVTCWDVAGNEAGTTVVVKVPKSQGRPK